MQKRAQRFDPRQNMNGNTFEIFHYLDIKTRHMDAHYHDFYEIFCFLNGNVDYWIDGDVFHLKSGDILLINPTELHKPIALNETEDYERIVLWVNKNYLASIDNGELCACFDVKSATYKKILRPSSAKKNELISLFHKLIEEVYSNEFAKNTYQYSLLLQIMTQINRISLIKTETNGEKYRSKTIISEVLEYIGEHYNQDLSLERIAGHFFVSKYYLSHEFSRAVGTSIHRYIILKRLNIAYDLISNGTSPGEAGRLCGFSDYTNFFRAFKAEYGISPRECSL